MFSLKKVPHFFSHDQMSLSEINVCNFLESLQQNVKKKIPKHVLHYTA